MTKPFIHFQPLIPGTLIRRYKRFLSEILLKDSGETVTAHCPNSGSMLGCCEPGSPVWISNADKPGRKLKYTWELIETPGSLVGINTLVPNRLAEATLLEGGFEEFAISKVKREITVEKGARIDIAAFGTDGETTFIEIKNCTLVKDQTAIFPDAVTKRGRHHLEVLARLAKAGKKSAIIFIVQRMDALRFMPAETIDPEFAAELRKAAQCGVLVTAYDTIIDTEKIRINKWLPVIL